MAWEDSFCVLAGNGDNPFADAQAACTFTSLGTAPWHMSVDTTTLPEGPQTLYVRGFWIDDQSHFHTGYSDLLHVTVNNTGGVVGIGPGWYLTPNGDGYQDTADLTYKLSAGSTVTDDGGGRCYAVRTPR